MVSRKPTRRRRTTSTDPKKPNTPEAVAAGTITCCVGRQWRCADVGHGRQVPQRKRKKHEALHHVRPSSPQLPRVCAALIVMAHTMCSQHTWHDHPARIPVRLVCIRVGTPRHELRPLSIVRRPMLVPRLTLGGPCLPHPVLTRDHALPGPALFAQADPAVPRNTQLAQGSADRTAPPQDRLPELAPTNRAGAPMHLSCAVSTTWPTS